jgi:hypothetical protein
MMRNNQNNIIEQQPVFQRKLDRKDLEVYKKQLSLTEEQKEVLVGTLLGDASMSIAQGMPVYCVKFEQGSANKDYLFHLFEIFKPYVGTGPQIRVIERKVTKEEVVWKQRESYSFKTYRHDDFKPYFHMFYTTTINEQGLIEKKVKVVPNNIEQLLTARALAYWFMDDGSCKVYGLNKNKTYVLHTQGFTKEEVVSLSQVFNNKFDLKCSVYKDKKGYTLGFLAGSSQKFKALVQPYVVDGFVYKL